MKIVVAITGTPGTGKTTISRMVAGKLGSCELISANDLVKEKGLYTGHTKDGEIIVDMRKLGSEIGRRIRSSSSDAIIIEGHLLCDIRVNGAVAIVIREHLGTLLDRMEKRGYGRKKIEDNIVAEAIDYCGVNAMGNYTEVYEIESGAVAVDQILRIIKGGRPKNKDIEMLGELDSILKKLGKAVI
jgi:adenylate kinase